MNHCRFFTIFTLAMLGASMPAALQAQSPNVGAASNQADTGGDQWRSSRLNWSGRDAAPDNQLRGASGAASRDVGGPTSSSVAVPSMTPLPEQSVSFRAAPATPSVATAAIQPSAPVANPNATPPANPFAAPATNPNVAPPANSFITPAANPNAAPISSNRLIEARKPEDIQNAPSGAPWNGNTVQEASYEPQMGPYPQSNASATPAGGYDSAPRDYYRTFSKYAPSDGYSPEVREWARRESASSTRKQPRASGGILSSASLVRAGRPGVNRSMQNRGGVRTVSYAPQMAPQGQSGQMSGPIMGDYEELPPGGNSSADGYSQGYGGTTSGDYVVDEYDSLGYPTGFYDQNGCVQNGCVPQCYPADNMCHLFECCWTKQRGIFIGGWTTQSYTWNPGRPADRFNGPVTMTDRSNDYQLNQQYLYLDRPTFTDGEGLDVGGRADMLFGTDARFTTTEGLENGVNRNNNSFYQLAFPQFYGEVAYNNLKVRMGHFYSPTGYFSVPTVNNFFNSLPYTFQYGEPFTQFGLLATWTANQHWTIGAGFNRGWDNMTGGNPNLGLVGTLAWTGNHNDRLAFTFIQDHEPDYNSAGVTPPAGGRVYTSRYLQTLVYSKQFTDRFSWVAQSDLGVQGAAFGPGTRTARWYGLNQYWFYKINESWTWGLGYEWFRDEEGFRVGQVVPSVFNPNGRSSPVPGGFAGNFNQCTFGPQWRPNGSKNLMIRPNCRYDWYGGPTSLNVPGALPYDSGTRSQQFIWGTDISLIY